MQITVDTGLWCAQFSRGFSNIFIQATIPSHRGVQVLLTQLSIKWNEQTGIRSSFSCELMNNHKILSCT